jgi:two-component system sensor histidine kinase/response regulator
MKKILILDDNGASRLAMVELLSAEEYEVHESGDGLDGLQIVAREHPDLVIAEVLMPRLDGFTLCHMLKSEPATASIPVVLLTRHPPTREDEAFALSVGAEHFLLKPVASEVLVALVGRLMLRAKVLPLAVRGESEYLRGYVARLRHQIREHTSEIDRAQRQSEETNSEVARARAQWLANEREELNRHLRRARTRLDELQSQYPAPPVNLRFDADVSNDMHGIMTMIMRSSDLLLSGAQGSLPEPQAERLFVIREGSRRVLDVLNALRAAERSSVPGGVQC